MLHAGGGQTHPGCASAACPDQSSGELWGRGRGSLSSRLLMAPPSNCPRCGIIVIASVYIGFSVADGRPRVIAIEVGVATAFVVLATTAITGPASLLVAGLTAHGLKDFWQHRTHFVANTRWWPPFCPTADWVAAAVLAAAITTGVSLT